MSYQPWKGKLEDGTEVLVSLELGPFEEWVAPLRPGYEPIQSVEVAFRSHRQQTWGPPVTLERAP